MSEPTFTAVLAACNEEEMVGDAIRSVLTQTRTDLELIVVDDGSTDATAAVVQGYMTDSRVRMIRQANRGLAASLNVGARAGEASLIALIDADDIWAPRFLESLHAAITGDPGAGFAFTDSWWYEVEGDRFFRTSISERHGAPQVVPRDPEEVAASILRSNWIFGLTLIRREAFERAGGFDESLRSCEDLELWLRLLSLGYRAVRTPGRLAIQRDRRSSMSADEAAMLESLARVYAIAARELSFGEQVRRIAVERERSTRERLARLRSAGSAARLRRSLRLSLGRLSKRLLGRRVWHRGVPEEVRRTFPPGSWRPRKYDRA